MYDFNYVANRFADLQLLRYQVKDFESLSLRQKAYLYYLTEAALNGRDILFDQNGAYNLQIRKLLERIYLNHTNKPDDPQVQALTVYLQRVWFSSGIHHHYACDKFKPEFTETQFRIWVSELNDAELPLYSGQTRSQMLETLIPVIFNPNVLPKRVNQADGEDLITTSANNYYAGVTQTEAEAFYAARKAEDNHRPVMHGMNSRLVKGADGRIKEEVWKIGGMYTQAIEKIVYWLKKALTCTENEAQAEVIRLLIAFYETGDLKIFDQYSIAWLNDTESRIDFVNGFIESYGDPLGMKASWESIVNFKDIEATHRTETLSRHAQWFEDHSPVNPAFRKPVVKGVSAKVITAAILAGDLYPASAIGINLPNSNWIRSEHGSKSVTIGNLTEAYNKAAANNGFREAFVPDVETRTLLDRYADQTDDLHTDLHECLGHGSGRLLPGVDPDALKAYGSTIEEARADLFGLYYMADTKLVELGLLPDTEAYKAAYYAYLLNGLMTQLVRIEPGAQIEEAHMRNRALIARWVLERAAKSQIAELKQEAGKTYLYIYRYEALRTLFGELLQEIQRIKSEGDYPAAKQLVETYGIHIDSELHNEILERYRALDLAPYKGFVNPVYTPVYDANQQLTDVRISYDEDYITQMLRYSAQYGNL